MNNQEVREIVETELDIYQNLLNNTDDYKYCPECGMYSYLPDDDMYFCPECGEEVIDFSALDFYESDCKFVRVVYNFECGKPEYEGCKVYLKGSSQFNQIDFSPVIYIDTVSSEIVARTFIGERSRYLEQETRDLFDEFAEDWMKDYMA